MLPIAIYINSNSKLKSVFLLGTFNMIEEEVRLNSIGMETIKITPYVWSNKLVFYYKIRKIISSIINKLMLIGCPIHTSLFKYFNEFYGRLNKYYIDLSEIFGRHDIVSVVLPDDRSLAFGFLPAVIKVCLQLNIKTVIPPISYAADRTTMCNAHFRKQQKISVDNKLFKNYPKNLYYEKEGDESAISFYPAIVTELLYRFEALPNNPWVIGGGGAKYVLADGESTAKRYINLGCSPQKVIISGHTAHDDLFFTLKNKSFNKEKILKKYGCGERSLTILSLPQLGEHNILSWEEHWSEIHFLCKVFSAYEGEVLISLHPKMKILEYQFIESEYSIPICNEPLREILPLADIFVATFSSTIEWAVLCEIPAIVFDFYGLGYDIYDGYDGVVVTDNRLKLPIILSEIQNKISYYEQLKKAHAKKARLLSPFDGRCMQRVVHELIRLEKTS